MSDEMRFWEAVDAIRAAQPRFMRPAYGFVVEALQETVKALPADRLADAEARHLSGQELLAGVVRVAREQFGPLAPAVFREWGIERAEDVGAIVFELVECKMLSARPEDTAADFAGGLDLATALAAPLEWGRVPVTAPSSGH